eukprot:SAG11_NODE_178_length_13331_cov_17.694906_4_plen_85_part_00
MLFAGSARGRVESGTRQRALSSARMIGTRMEVRVGMGMVVARSTVNIELNFSYVIAACSAARIRRVEYHGVVYHGRSFIHTSMT